MPEALVRDAVRASPAWSDIAAAMASTGVPARPRAGQCPPDRTGPSARTRWPARPRKPLLMTSGYPPLPEPFAAARGEAAHTAAMAHRLVLAISDAVRRAAQKRFTGLEEELGEDAEAMVSGWSAEQLRGHLGDDVSPSRPRPSRPYIKPIRNLRMRCALSLPVVTCPPEKHRMPVG